MGIEAGMHYFSNIFDAQHMSYTQHITNMTIINNTITIAYISPSRVKEKGFREGRGLNLVWEREPVATNMLVLIM